MRICYNEKKCINRGLRHTVSGSLFCFLDRHLLKFLDIQKMKRGGNHVWKTKIVRRDKQYCVRLTG